MRPSDEIAEILELDESLGANVYRAPESQIVAPAIVFRPDEPWMVKARPITERYAAIAVVTASTPKDGLAELHRLVHRVLVAVSSAEGWGWYEVGTVILDESTGSPFLACRVRLGLQDCTGGEEA